MSNNKLRAAIVIVFVAAAVIGGHLLPGFDNSRVEDGVRNGLHVLVFAIVALIVVEFLMQSGMSVLVATLLTATLVALIGVSAEAVQYLSGSQPDVFDVVRDMSGATLALTGRMLWRWTSRSGKSVATKLIGRAISAAVSSMVLAPLAFWLAIIVYGRMASPVILDFEEWWNEFVYRPINAETDSHSGVSGSVEIKLQKRGRSGLVVSPIITDWSSYEFLSISAGMMEGPDTNVTIKINDSVRKNNWSDQFVVAVIVESNVRRIRVRLRDLVPKSAPTELYLSDIRELVIFARDRRSNLVMLIEDIRLE